MLTKKQYDCLIKRIKERQQLLDEAIRRALAKKAKEANERPVLDLDDPSC